MRVLHIHERDLMPIAPGRARPRTGAGGDRVGGLGAYLCSVFDALSDRGVEVSTLAVGPATGVASARDRYAEAPGFRFRFDRAKSEAILTEVARADPDVVHIHAAYFTLHPRTAACIGARWATVCTMHDVTSLCYRGDKCFRGGARCDRRVGIGCVSSGCYRLGSRLPLPADLARVANTRGVRAMYASLPALIAPSRFIADVLIANGCDADRVRVHPLFSRFEEAARGPTAMGVGGPPVVLFVGRLDAGKGAELFVDALGRLGDGDWRGEIVGDGPMRAEVEHRAGPLIRAGRLVMRGSLDHSELADAYRRARVVVFPSMIQESFGLVGLEAMSFARPVVALPSGGVIDWLEDGVTGLLVRRAGAEDLAGAVRTLLHDAGEAGSMGEAGRRRVLERFTRAGHIDRLTALYESIERATGTPR